VVASVVDGAQEHLGQDQVFELGDADVKERRAKIAAMRASGTTELAAPKTRP
jgi:hypothetical protein